MMFKTILGAIFSLTTFWLITFCGWLTNVYMLLTDNGTLTKVLIGIAGIPFFPLGAIRGILHWFGL